MSFMKKTVIRIKYLVISALLLISIFFIPDAGTAAGWYVRGTLGYEWSRSADFSDTDCSSTNPPALFGCAKGGNGKAIGAYGDFGHFPLAELAVGRQLLPWLRTDLSFAYRFNMDYEGNANFTGVGTHQPVSTEAESFSGMANLFLDINGFIPNRSGRFQPYLGGGIGVAHNRIDEMTFRFPDNTGKHKISITPSGDRTEFAFMLAIGTGIVLTEHVILDIAYRYFDLGHIGTSPGRMTMDIKPAGIEINDIEAPLRTHGPALGLRYSF